MQSNITGNFLVSESAGTTNHIARAIDSTVTGMDSYFHVQLDMAANEQSTSVSFPLTQINVLYVKSTKVSDGTASEIIIELDGYSGSVTTGEVKASEILLINTDIVAITLSNDGPAVLVEIAAVGD